MADRFWKSMPKALKRPTLDDLYRRLRDLDYTQVDERMAVMLNAILQLEEQGECRESATEAVLMVGYTTDGISNQEQTRWLSWNVDGGVRGFDLARNPGLSNNTEYGAGEFPLPTRPSARSAGQHTSMTPSMTRAQQTEEAYPDRVPEGTVHLIIGDSLLRVLTRIQSHWQTGILSFAGAAMPQILASLEMLGMARVYTVTLMIGTNDLSRGESRKVMRLHDKMSCILEELRIQMDPAILTVCTVPYNMKADQHAMEMNTKVRNLNEVVRQIHQRSVLPIGLLDVAEQMERAAFSDDASSDGIHFDRPRGVEWLNDVFQRHISALEADLLETAQFTFGPPPNPPFLASRTLSSRLGARVDSRDSSRSSRTRLPGAAPMEAEEATSSTPLSSVVSSVVVVESKRVERPVETSRSRYLEKVRELDLEDLECRQQLAEALGLERVSHEDLSRHQCVDWLKAHETHFSRARIMETADLTGIPTRLVMGPINYRPLKLLGSSGLIVEPPKHRTSYARIKLATPAQLRVVDKLLDPRELELPDAAYEGTRLADDPRYGKPCGNAQLAKTLAVYDRADPAAARVIW